MNTTTGYESSKQDKGLLRRSIEGALTGAKSLLGLSAGANPERDDAKQVELWTKELELAKTFFREFQEQGSKCNDAYLDDSQGFRGESLSYSLNLFHANVTTIESIMFAKLPKVEADRRFADPNDDVARVASEIVTRLLQNDMNDPEDRLKSVLKQSLQDRLIVGLGNARVRYCMEEKEQPEAGVEYDEANPVPTVKSDEWTDIEYVHWRDVLWSPCRTPAELRWKAFRSYMTKAQITARFGEDIAGMVPYSTRGPKLDSGESSSANLSQHQDTAQAEVWEIWDKVGRRVVWFVEGCSRLLDEKADPMELGGFFPDAPPMVANASTSKYIPKADYLLAESLYREINELEQRMAILTKACRVVGVYPSSAKEIKQILSQAGENAMIPVENWAMFADKGGLKGQIDYFPIKDVAETLQILAMQQQQRIQQLYQVTGMSDIIRGQATTSGVTATEQRIKAQFASTRMQSFQDEFAEFTAELLNRKVELIRKYYDPERIKKLSNIMQTPDAALADQAIELIKDEDSFACRITIKSESMAQIDYEALKTERAEFMGAVAQFLGSVGPILKEMPQAAPFMLELLKFNLAGMKAANQMEGVIDAAVAALLESEKQKAEAPPEPSPEEKAAQAKTEGAMQIAQVKAAADAQSEQARVAADTQIAQQEFALERQKMQLEMEQMREEHQLEMEKMRLEIEQQMLEMDMKREDQQLELAGKQMEMQLDSEHQQQEHESRLEQQRESHDQTLEQNEQAAQQRAEQDEDAD